MRVIKDNLWFCGDCTTTSIDCYYGLENPERLNEILAGLEKFGSNVVPDFDSDRCEGIREFSSRQCDCCGTHLRGYRARFAILGE